MSPWHDVGTALARDDVFVASGIGAPLDGDYPVEVWSAQGATLLSRFDTVVDFGGHRLALATPGDRPVVVAAAYDRLGVAGYDALTGERLWQRTDLKRGQQITPGGDVAVASFDVGPAHVLDARTGVTTARLRGVQRFWLSGYHRIGVGERSMHIAAYDTASVAELWRFRFRGFALLDAAFSPDAMVVSDVVDAGVAERATAGASVYCLDLSGRLLWDYRPAPMALCAALGWDVDGGEWVGIEHDVNGRAEDTLIRWSTRGHVVARHGLGRALGRYWFLPSGRHAVTDRRELLDSRTAQRVVQFPPQGGVASR